MKFQVMRRALAVFHNQISKISNSARELSEQTNLIFHEQNNDIQSSLERIKNY